MANYEIPEGDALAAALDALQGDWKTVRLALHYALTDGTRSLLAAGARAEAAFERAKIAHDAPGCAEKKTDGRVLHYIKGLARDELARRERRAAVLDAAADVIQPPVVPF